MVSRVSKTAMMALVARGEMRETFEHDAVGIIDVTAMREIASTKGEFVDVQMEHVCPFVKENRVFDAQRVDDLPDDAWRDDPIMYIRIVEPPPLETSYLLIDGSHRVLRREKEGQAFVGAVVFEMADIIRPDFSKLGFTRDLLDIDWGDDIVNGVIVRGAP